MDIMRRFRKPCSSLLSPNTKYAIMTKQRALPRAITDILVPRRDLQSIFREGVRWRLYAPAAVDRENIFQICSLKIVFCLFYSECFRFRCPVDETNNK